INNINILNILNKYFCFSFLFLCTGTNAGIYVTPYIGSTDFFDGCEKDRISCDKKSYSYGAHVGFQLYHDLAIELGYNNYGSVEAKYPALENDNQVATYTADTQSLEFGLVKSFPIHQDFKVRFTGGASYWFVDMNGEETNYTIRKSSNGISPYLSTSLIYKIDDNLSFDSGLKWVNSVGSSSTGESSIYQIFLGMTYNFNNQSDLNKPIKYLKDMPQKEVYCNSTDTSYKHDNHTQDTVLTIYFDFDNSHIDKDSSNSLSLLSSKISPGDQLLISAYSDTYGAESYNDALSLRRANEIRLLLLKSGIEKHQIHIINLGEEQNSTAPVSFQRKAIVELIKANRNN
ncbi:OmpA family protein, partial [Vibrio lentus]|uniref:OmpA family protein n=1 Tax=Vibrio lentus TaxID=136468 RepID=UPI000CBA82E7